MKLIYGQYQERDYPLKRYHKNEIQANVMDAVSMLVKKDQVVIRGGLAYILLFDREEYCLKDLDFLSMGKEEEEIAECLKGADEIYVNRNTFGESVVTGFWRDGTVYYKLDVLMNQSSIAVEKCLWNHIECKVVSRSYLWTNRMIKIAEKEERHHTDAKTINHYKVAGVICEFMLQNHLEIEETHRLIVKQKLEKIQAVLTKLLCQGETEKFITDAQKLLALKTV